MTDDRSMSLLYTEVEEELRAAVRDLLTDKSPASAVLARAEATAAGAVPYDLDLWKALARDIGAAGLLVPEELGGAGASGREAAVVLEELGRTVAAVPFLSSAVLATQALLSAGGPVAASVLERLASGEATAALAVPFAGSPYFVKEPAVTLNTDGAVSGTVTGVIGAEVADVLVVPVRLASDGRTALCVVETGAGVEVTRVTSLDLTRPIATVSFSGAVARVVAMTGEETAGETAGEPGRAWAPGVREALVTGAGLLASEQLGVAEWCLSTTVAYVKERKQFARPVGSFQAVKHRLADLWLEVVGARAAARNAAALLAASAGGPSTGAEPGAAAGVAVAQAHCGAVAVHAAEECVQLHGGIGMTWEHPAHLYLKRAKADQIGLGTPGDHREALAVLADLPAPA